MTDPARAAPPAGLTDGDRATLRALREAEERLRLTLDHAPIGMALVALDGRWEHVNARVCEIVGYSAAELCQLTFQDITHPDDLESDLSLVAALLRGQIPRYELPKRYIRKDGRIAETLLHVSLLRGEDGEPRQFISQIVDVTEQNRLQARIAVSDRMAAIGTLASGVGHEINNPLTYVILNLDRLARDLASFAPLAADAAATRLASMTRLLEEARSGTERIRKIAHSLRTLSRGESIERRSVDLPAALESSVSLVLNEIHFRARLVMDIGPVPVVFADESRLVQVFVNLLANAAQAIPEGRADANEIRVTTRTDEAGRAVVEVRDTGAGIPPHLLARVFDPFYTTKDVGAGTGLGLSISHAIVASFGGEIEVKSAPSEGTVFRVTLPPHASDRASDVPPSESPAPLSKKAEPRARLLIIDDEKALVRGLRVALEGRHEVTALTEPRQALERIGAGARFDVILCDLMMPEVSGREVYQHLTSTAPDQAERMIFMTGGAFTDSSREFLESVANPRIEKPFDIEELRGVVDALLAAHPRR